MTRYKSKKHHFKIINSSYYTKYDTRAGRYFFFYRPKVRSEKVESIDDVRRFFVVLAPESKNLYRLLIIGKKSLPEIRESEVRSSERYWARVGGIFDGPTQLTNELLSKEFREGEMARPVGEGKYAIVDHNNHTELAFVLELPKELGEAQKELGIEKEASYIITVINPKIPKEKNTYQQQKTLQTIRNLFSTILAMMRISYRCQET